VENPEMYAAALFREAFERNGVRMTGVTKKGRIPVSARMLASHISAPVTSALRDVLKDSDNLASELILKSMARYATGRPGSAEDGLRVLRGALRAVAGLDTLEYRLADGSGLSWYNLVTPDQIVALLSAASRDSLIRTPLMDALPVAGVDGSLTNRMRASAAAGKAMAKTGTLSGVSCLSGFVRTQDDETLVFSIMINHYIGSSSVARRAQDDVVSALAGLSRHQKRGDTP
jgi:D-alanyl-D-alanine carboxypeptidase/D-alanyl-D-alanine-endopeptidase (penicillin-binding protein 4)